MSTGSLEIEIIDLLAAVGLGALAVVIVVVVLAGVREWRSGHARHLEEQQR